MLLVFLIQWIFLGDLRSAIIVGINIPFALFFSIIMLVIRGEDANLLSLGAVDFGIIVDSAVIVVENIFRVFQAREREELLRRPTPIAENGRGAADASLVNRIRLIYISATQVDTAVLFSTVITLAAFVPLFTMQGVEGQIFSPMARTYAYALLGALFATFTITPVLASFLLPEHVEETETIVVRAIRAVYTPVLTLALRARRLTVMLGVVFLVFSGLLASRLGTEFLPALEEGNLWIRASMPPTISLEAGMPIVEPHAANPQSPSRGHHRRLPAWPARQRQRRDRLLQRRVLRALEALRGMGARPAQGATSSRTCRASSQASSPAST